MSASPQTVESTALKAVVPPRIRRRWDAIALQQLAKIAAEQAEYVDQLQSIEASCQTWMDHAQRLEEQLTAATGAQFGITQDSQLVTVRQ